VDSGWILEQFSSSQSPSLPVPQFSNTRISASSPCSIGRVPNTLELVASFPTRVFDRPSFIIDVLTSGWVVIVFALLFGFLPSIAFPQQSLPSFASRLVGAFIRTVATISIGSILWVKLGIFTWMTAVLTYGTGLTIGWMASHQWQSRSKFEQLGHQIAIATVDIFDRGISTAQIADWLSLPWRAIFDVATRNEQPEIPARFDRQPTRQLLPNGTSVARLPKLQPRPRKSLPLTMLAVIAAIAIVGSTVWLRFEHPLIEFRFSHPDTYEQLLITQQILARDLPTVNHLPIFASLAAFISALSGVHPLQVVHLLGAIVGTLLVLSIGYTIAALTKNGAATLAAMYSLGTYLFTWNLPIPQYLPPGWQQCLRTIADALDRGLIRSWAASESELGALFVILAIGCSTQIARTKQRTDAIVNTLCCTLLVATISPHLLLLILFGGFGSIFGRQMALFTIGVAWTLLAVLAAIPDRPLPLLAEILKTLPIGLSLLVGLLFIAIASASKSLLASWSSPICLMMFIAITLNFCLPPLPAIDYLEYDAAARKAVEIGHIFPPQQWTVVAPIEQLSQVYGRGWYEDVAEFTHTYQQRVTVASFHFPHKTPLLVFTEKLAFTTDKPEYPVPYSVLIDPTYRNYRSPSGRKKLAATTLQLCETYRRHHPDTLIYYENDRLRIYQFAPAVVGGVSLQEHR
jgi:hypothetical protein